MPEKNNLEKLFDKYNKEIGEECRKNLISSDNHYYRNFDSYKKITAMGPSVIPLIRKEIALSRGVWLGWQEAIEDITGTYTNIPKEKRKSGKMYKVAYLNWLDENMNKFFSMTKYEREKYEADNVEKLLNESLLMPRDAGKQILNKVNKLRKEYRKRKK